MKYGQNIRCELREARANTECHENLTTMRPGHEFKSVTVVPSQIRERSPVLVVPGFSENIEQSKTAAQYIAHKTGRICLGIEIGIDGIKYEGGEILSISLRDEILKSSEDLSVHGRVSVVAHSAGAIAMAQAASHEPGIFKSAVAWSPAGLNPSRKTFKEAPYKNLVRAKNIQNLGRFALMTGAHGAKRIVRDVDIETVGFFRNAAKKLYGFHPTLIAAYLNYISLANIKEDLGVARKKGVRLGLTHGNRDAMFPRSELESNKVADLFHELRWMLGPKVNGHFPMGSFAGLRQLRNYVIDTEKSLNKTNADSGTIGSISLAE